MPAESKNTIRVRPHGNEGIFEIITYGTDSGVRNVSRIKEAPRALSFALGIKETYNFIFGAIMEIKNETGKEMPELLQVP